MPPLPAAMLRHPTMAALEGNVRELGGGGGRTVSVEELRANEGRWVAIAGRVYDMQEFLDGKKRHPGGNGVFKKHLGKDATTLFMQFHYPKGTAVKWAPGMLVGTLEAGGLGALGEDDEDDDDEGSLLDPL